MPTKDQVKQFYDLFRGNPLAHYVRHEDGQYVAVERGITEQDVEYHLHGEQPSLLSIPIDASGLSHFGVIDVDRHGDEASPLDHAALARQVTEMNLPLVVFRSRGGKGCWLLLFVKEENGAPAGDVRAVLTQFSQQLGFSEHVDIFPRQTALGDTQKGNGVNLGYFGKERPAFGADGAELTLEQFLEFAQERAAYVSVLVQRVQAEKVAQAKPDDGAPLPANVIRDLHQKNIDTLKSSAPGNRNNTLNVAVFFAARAFAANILERTEKELKEDLTTAGLASGMQRAEIESTLRSAWSKGAKQPLAVLDTEKERADALARLRIEAESKSTTRGVEDVLRDCARLDAIEYEPLRVGLAKALLIRPKVLDDEVRKRRPKVEESEGLRGSAPSFSDREPWPEPVDPAAMLDEIRDTLCRFIYFHRKGDAETVALWTVLTHARDRFHVAPYLRVSSPIEGCGKSTLLRLVTNLAYRPVEGSNITSAVVFRIVDLYHPTLVIDELDTFLEGDPQFIGILNSGHERDLGFVYRCVGDDQEVRKFSTFGPKIYGMIGTPKGPFASRSIPILLIRKSPEEKIEDFNKDEPETARQLDRLHRQIARWVKDREEHFQTSKIDAAGLSNRSRDNWLPLLTIAELAGGRWPNEARFASGLGDPTARDSDEKILLRDLRNIFYSKKATWIPSRELVSDLKSQTHSPWATFGKRADGINEHQLGVLLKGFGVEHSRRRQKNLDGMNGEASLTWGYDLQQFKELFGRLLSEDQPDTVEVARTI